MLNIINRISKRKTKEGFTLIELIVTVAIIGIITAIAIPSYGGIQELAKKRAVAASVQTTYSSILAIVTQDAPVSASNTVALSFSVGDVGAQAVASADDNSPETSGKTKEEQMQDLLTKNFENSDGKILVLVNFYDGYKLDENFCVYGQYYEEGTTVDEFYNAADGRSTEDIINNPSPGSKYFTNKGNCSVANYE